MPNPQSVMVPVIQADRDLAADIWAWYVAKTGEVMVEKGLREGSIDEGLPTLLARHRLQQASSEEVSGEEVEDALTLHRSLQRVKSVYVAQGIRTTTEVPFSHYVIGPEGEVAHCQTENGEQHAEMIAAALNDRVAMCKLPANDTAASKRTSGGELASTCDGKEQYAFEKWAKSQRFDMNEHPLHYLFLDPRTDAARKGWKAGLQYASDIARAALNPDAVKGELGR